jgi:hypothetical protein
MKEINVKYYQQLLDLGRFSQSDRTFYQNVLNSVKNKNGMVTDRQYNVLQQIKSGKSSYSPKNEHMYNQNKPMNQTNQLRQLIRESINEYIREVETSGNIAAQEAKIRACEEAIALREKKANMEGLDEAYHDMMDSTKINELKKEIKELQKYKSKAEKVLDKMKMKSEGKTAPKKTKDEKSTDEGIIDEISIDENDPESGPQLEEETEQIYEMLLLQKRAGIITETEYKVKVEEAKKKASAGLTKKEKSTISKKAHAGKDIGKKGKNFDKVAKAAGGGEKGKKIAAAAMWKGEAKKAKSLKEQVQDLFKNE